MYTATRTYKWHHHIETSQQRGDLLAYATHSWGESVTSELHVVSLDVSKAFDWVWHRPKRYEIRVGFCTWIEDGF